VKFFVRDARTREVLEGKVLAEFALKNCPNIIHCDLEGFFIGQDGQLILADECGSWDYIDPKKAIVVFEADSL
jgi:hypothetical protein